MRFLSVILGVLVVGRLYGAIVFSDSFNRADGSTVGPGWTETDTGGGDAVISSGALVIKNGSPAGRSFVTYDMSGLNPGYATTLSQNSGTVRWSINMRSSRDNLSGFAANNYGIAFVLASSSADLLSGTGYAVVWGGSGTQPLRLVRFDAGLVSGSSVSDVIVAQTAPFNDVTRNYLSVQVEFNPFTSTWALAARDDGAAAFTDPTTGSLASLGQGLDTTYTGQALPHTGAFWNYSTAAGNQAQFDNLQVEVVPEPATAGWIAAGVLALAAIARWRQTRHPSTRLPAGASGNCNQRFYRPISLGHRAE